MHSMLSQVTPPSIGNTAATAAVTVPVTVVSSVAEFTSIFQGGSSTTADVAGDAFLLCYEQPADGVTSDGLFRFQDSVSAAARKCNTRLRLFLWDCSNSAFTFAKAQLEKQPGYPLLLIIFRGAIADSIRGVSLAHMTAENVPQLCSRLSSFQSSAKPARVTQEALGSAGSSSGSGGGGVVGAETSDTEENSSSPLPSSPPLQQQQQQRLSVDVAKMVGMGQRLMAERKPLYAEKFFAKALTTLDAVSAEVDQLVCAREDYDGSVALCLAWAGLAQLVQGKQTVGNTYLRRLRHTESLRAFREAPMSDACRALVTWELIQVAPRTWSEAECGETRLRAVLQGNPHDAAARSLLVVTLFLSGDLERAMTEALKLHVCGESFGRLALRQLSAFVGSDHALVKQLGISSLLKAASP